MILNSLFLIRSSEGEIIRGREVLKRKNDYTIRASHCLVTKVIKVKR